MWLKNEFGKKSVTVTFATTTFVVLLISYLLEMFDLVKTPSGLLEMFYALVGLYAYRKTSIKTGKFQLSNEIKETDLAPIKNKKERNNGNQ